MKLNHEHIEEYLLLLADRELDQTTEDAVRAFVGQHDQYKPLLEAYLATSTIDTDVFVFPDKESLLQPETAVMLLRKMFVSLKMAAAVILILGLGAAFLLMFRSDVPSTGPSVAAIQEHKGKGAAAPLNRTAVVRPEEKADGNNNTSKALVKPMRYAHKGPVHSVAAHSIPVARLKEDIPAELAPAAVAHITINPEQQSDTIIPEQVQPSGVAGVRAALPVWLPVQEENLQGVQDLIAHIQVLRVELQAKTKTLRNAIFVISIGDKQIPVN